MCDIITDVNSSTMNEFSYFLVKWPNLNSIFESSQFEKFQIVPKSADLIHYEVYLHFFSLDAFHH